MNAIKVIVREVIGLFVDDRTFAFLIIAWIAITALLSFHALPDRKWGTPLLFLGLVVILVQSAIRRARSSN
jgi:hypothetical protein